MNEDKLFVLTDTPHDFPKYVGRCEILPNIVFNLTRMPNRFHRVMMTLLLGWKFVEYTSSKKMLLNG